MPKTRKKGLTPELILENLVQEVQKQGYSDLLPVLESARPMLPAMSESRFERPARDSLAGTIATIIGVKCCQKAPATVILVCSQKTQKANAEKLQRLLDCLRDLGYLASTRLAVKESADCYVCIKRLKNAKANGHDLSDKLERRLTTQGLDRSTKNLIHVQSCSNSCRYRDQCRYQNLRQKMIEGEIPYQVYSEQQYLNALRNNQLPKSRLVIYEPVNGRLSYNDQAPVFRQKELEQVLLQSERLCSSATQKKKAVCKETASVREAAKKYFSLPPSRSGSLQAQELLTDIHGSLIKIQDLCVNELVLKGIERKRWRQGLQQAIQAVETLLQGLSRLSR